MFGPFFDEDGNLDLGALLWQPRPLPVVFECQCGVTIRLHGETKTCGCGRRYNAYGELTGGTLADLDNLTQP